MNFEPINWKVYNKPPYLPQWLSIGETKKFVSFDDDKLIEIEGQIYNLSNQWDIDAAKAVLLDRIGKIVGEARDGNDDDLFRLLIKLRILLNTTNGTVNDIIKVIKFIYSSNVIEITPKYPAAVLILHDGEQEYIDYNRILTQVIGAGIGYETRQLFGFVDIVKTHELFKITDAYLKLVDSFSDTGIKFDGSHKHDGSITAGREIKDKLVIVVRPKGFVDVFRGRLKHNGAVNADGSHNFDGEGPISDYFFINTNVVLKDKVDVIEDLKIITKTEFTDSFPTGWMFDGSHKHNGEIKANASTDKLVIMQDGPGMIDVFTSRLKHNGAIKADGSRKFDAITNISDLPLKIQAQSKFVEKVTMAEKFIIHINQRLDFIDYFPTAFKFDGAFKHDGAINPAGSTDKLVVEVDGPNATDIFRRKLTHNGTVIADGSNQFNGESTSIGDVLSISMKYHHKHNGEHQANGNRNFNSGILIPA